MTPTKQPNKAVILNYSHFKLFERIGWAND